MTAAAVAVATAVEGSKREAVLAAALELFEERTFAGCAMPLVADRAGVGAGTIYRYFAGKEALANALYQRWKTTMGEHLFDVDDADDVVDAHAAFLRLWGRLFTFARDHPKALAFLETHKHAAYLDEASRTTTAAVDAKALAFVERLEATGALRPAPAEELIAMVFGAFVGLVKAMAAGALRPSDALVTRTGDAVWRALAAAPTVKKES